MSIKESLERLQKSVADLAGGDAPEEMTVEQFIAYTEEQIAKAKEDSDEVRVQRLKHLADQIEIAKNFEGSPATPGGILRVNRFKDPDQLNTPEKTQSPGNATPATQFTSNEPQPGVQGAGSTPPGGNMPPMTAGGSGFDSPATATFAKSMEEISKGLAELLAKAEGKADADPKPEGDKTEPEVKTEDADADKGDKVEKSTGVIWPLDMTSDFGMGKTEDPEEPEWGYDAGSEGARRAETRKAAASK